MSAHFCGSSFWARGVSQSLLESHRSEGSNVNMANAMAVPAAVPGSDSYKLDLLGRLLVELGGFDGLQGRLEHQLAPLQRPETRASQHTETIFGKWWEVWWRQRWSPVVTETHLANFQKWGPDAWVPSRLRT